MTNEELMERVEETLNGMAEADQMDVWNEYCNANNYTDDRIEYNEPDELLYGQTPSDILNSVDMDEYNTNDTYAYCTIYGWRSTNYLEECQSFDLGAIADYVVNNEDALYNYELQQILDEYEEEEEEE